MPYCATHDRTDDPVCDRHVRREGNLIERGNVYRSAAEVLNDDSLLRQARIEAAKTIMLEIGALPDVPAAIRARVSAALSALDGDAA